jgi:hypothetical protein
MYVNEVIKEDLVTYDKNLNQIEIWKQIYSVLREGYCLYMNLLSSRTL